jgi:uncharacterized membrane protein
MKKFFQINIYFITWVSCELICFILAVFAIGVFVLFKTDSNI